MDDQELDYTSETEIRALAEGFESCSLEDFSHREHLAVAVWYLSRMTEEEAVARMRAGLMRFLAHHGEDPQKYNETITQFWIKRLGALLDQMDAARPLAERANEALKAAGSSKLVFNYYSRDRVFSDEARTTWVEPDLKRSDG